MSYEVVRGDELPEAEAVVEERELAEDEEDALSDDRSALDRTIDKIGMGAHSRTTKMTMY